MITYRRQRRALLILSALALTAMSPHAAMAAGVSVLTYHGDNARLGWNAHETALTPATVNEKTFGKLWQTQLDGPVNSSPLLVSGITVRGSVRDVVYAATDNNSVYALDSKSGGVLWARKELARALTDAESTGFGGNGQHGILGTPVIDLKSQSLYACTVRPKGLRQVYELWALDIRTGATKAGWPVTLKGEYKGTPFLSGEVMQRGALSLVDGWVYIPFGGRFDTPPWRGWIMGIDTSNPSAPQRAFSSSPDSDGAGIWSAGGLAADAGGALYAVTGNGDYDFDTGGDNLAQSVVRLTASGDALTFSRKPEDYFTASNHKELDEADDDLGGSSAVVLPDQTGTSTPHLLVTAGKDGNVYLINRDNLGGVGKEVLKRATFRNPGASYHDGIRSTPAYFDAGAAGRFLYIAGDEHGPDGNAGLAALKLTHDAVNGPARLKQVWAVGIDLERPTSPVVSSSGPAHGIVWEVEQSGDGSSALRALNALTGKELYTSSNGKDSDALSSAPKFVSPTVANGRVFVAADGVVCYGLTAKSGNGKKGK